MPNFDYRDVQHVSVGDLLDFDALMQTLTERQRETINRKIAHEVAEGEPASELETANEALEEAQRNAGASEARIEALDAEVKELKATIEDRRSAVRQLEKDLADADHNVGSLRRELVEAEGRHEKQLQEAEVRGYQRGRAEAAA